MTTHRDPYRRVHTGEPIELPAAAWNAMIDAAMAEQRQRSSIRLGPHPRALGPQAATVLLHNGVGYDLPRFGVAGIANVVISPADNADAFKGRIALAGVVPTTADYLGQFAIAQEPIPDGAIGRALVAGISIVQIEVGSTSHTRADVCDGDYTKLESGASGTARILWAESGTGTKWAIVRLGDELGLVQPWAKAAKNWSAAADSKTIGLCRVLAHPLAAGPGSAEDTDTDLTVYLWTPADANDRPLYGHPNVIDDQEFPIVQDAAGNWYFDGPGGPGDGIIGETIRPHHATTAPAGWEFLDGSGGRPDGRARVLVQYKSGDANADPLGNTFGNATQNLSHQAHLHPMTVACVGCSGTGSLAVNYSAWPGQTNNATVPAHSNVDMHQPSLVSNRMIRADNKVAW